MSMISVVVPVYNVSKYISDCVESLLSQTYKDFEVIFVDDGSLDNSVEIIKEKIKELSNFRVVSKVNGGLSSARNYGLKYVQSEFVTFLDSDDYLNADYLSKMIQSIDDFDICCCGYNEISENNDFIRTVFNELSWEDSSDIYGDVIEAIKFIPNAWGKLYRKNVFDKLNYPEGMLFEDFAIAYKLFFNERVKFINEPLYNYRIREGSIMRAFNNNIINHKIMILKEMKCFLKNKDIYEKYERNYINSFIFHGIFVTSCVIINQSPDGVVSLLKKLKIADHEKNFTFSNLMRCKTMKFEIIIFLILIKISPSLAFSLKRIKNGIGKLHG